MNWSTIGKYLAGAWCLGSVFALVWTGKVEAAVYVGLVTGTLASLGLYAFNKGGTQ